jgi:hypothetical protein
MNDFIYELANKFINEELASYIPPEILVELVKDKSFQSFIDQVYIKILELIASDPNISEEVIYEELSKDKSIRLFMINLMQMLNEDDLARGLTNKFVNELAGSIPPEIFAELVKDEFFQSSVEQIGKKASALFMRNPYISEEAFGEELSKDEFIQLFIERLDKKLPFSEYKD